MLACTRTKEQEPMSDRDQAIKDVSNRATFADVVAYAVFQRERVIVLERALREYLHECEPDEMGYIDYSVEIKSQEELRAALSGESESRK